MKFLKISSLLVLSLLLFAPAAQSAVTCTLGTSLEEIRMESSMEGLEDLTVTCAWTATAVDNTAVRVTGPAAGNPAASPPLAPAGAKVPTGSTGGKFNLELDLNGMLSEDAAAAPNLMLMDLNATTTPSLADNNAAGDGVKIPGISAKGYRTVAGEVSGRSVLWADVVFPATWNVPAAGSEAAGSGSFKISGITVDASSVDDDRLEATLVVTATNIDSEDDADIARVKQALDLEFSEDHKAQKFNACEPGSKDISINVMEGYRKAWADGNEILLTTSSGKISAEDTGILNVLVGAGGDDEIIINVAKQSSSKVDSTDLVITFEPAMGGEGNITLSAEILPTRGSLETFIESASLVVGSFDVCSGDSLFFPFVTSQAGWDTGLVVVNDSDIDGSCSLNWGNMTLEDDAKEALSKIEVKGKKYSAFVVSGKNADYQGSLGVECTFSKATGYVFLSDDVNGIGQGYLVKP